MSADGYRAAPAALLDAADGIDALVGELGELTTAGRAGAGRGVSGVRLDPDQLGHDGLAESFAAFCARWEWGVRALVRDGTGMAEGLRESVARYERADGDVGATLARLAGDVLLRDPGDDPAGAPGGETVGGALREVLSGDRWSRAADAITGTWAGVARDARDTAADRASRLAAGENPLGPELDALREIVE